MPSETPMAQPTKHIPTNEPAWHGQSPFLFRTKQTLVIRTIGIGTLHQLADQMQWALKGVNAMMPMLSHMHRTLAMVTPRVLDFQDDLGPGHVLWPTTSHFRCLLARLQEAIGYPGALTSPIANPTIEAGD
jgi:hypothetical protein